MYLIHHAPEKKHPPVKRWVSLIRDGGGAVTGFKYEQQQQDATKIDNFTAAVILRNQLEKVCNRYKEFFIYYVGE